MTQYEVIQWATGVVGRADLAGIIRHLGLELVGLRVYSEESDGGDRALIERGVPSGRRPLRRG